MVKSEPSSAPPILATMRPHAMPCLARGSFDSITRPRTSSRKHSLEGSLRNSSIVRRGVVLGIRSLRRTGFQPVFLQKLLWTGWKPILLAETVHDAGVGANHEAAVCHGCAGVDASLALILPGFLAGLAVDQIDAAVRRTDQHAIADDH